MLVEALIFFSSLLMLSWSADRFVFGASAMANNMGLSPMLIGMTIVAMGSSAPEIMVAATASLAGNTDTAVGNAIGSNITNVALVLGVCALVKPLLVSSTTIKRELPILLVVTLLAAYMLDDLRISRMEGIILFSMFILTLGGLGWLSTQSEKGDPLQREMQEEIPNDVPNAKAVFWVVVGIILLPLSASFMVDSAVVIAKAFGISDLVIGLTIIAIGTSLPELAASIAGVLKGEDDLALGNIIGSNIFNILAVMAMPGLIAPGVIDAEAVSRDMPVMLGMTFLLLLFSFSFKGRRQITRLEGAALLACFVSYQLMLFVF